MSFPLDLLTQMKTWNPWWTYGKEGIDRYRDPSYHREIYGDVFQRMREGKQIVSVVGMRQIGKSTLMRQMIRSLLEQNINPKHIFYLSFDDPFIRIHYDRRTLFDAVIQAYVEGVLNTTLDAVSGPLYFFFDEIHQLPQWEKALKAYYDRSYPIQYMVSGSSSLTMQTKHRESLLGRISEHMLWPFSFREFVEYHTKDNQQLLSLLREARDMKSAFDTSNQVNQPLYTTMRRLFQQLEVWHKESILSLLRTFILCGGFPRAWEQKDFVSRQRFLWEQHIGKVVFEDLVQVAHIRKPKDLEYMFATITERAGQEVRLSEMQHNLRMNWITFDRYLSYLTRTFLILRIDRTKSARTDFKRRAGNVKFYLTDVALRNALYNKTDDVFFDPQEMSIIAENLICSAVHRWRGALRREEQLTYYRERSGEVDFLFKYPGGVIPIEVKWRDSMPKLSTLDKLECNWPVSLSFLVTRNQELDMRKTRLSIPLWFFLLCF